MKLGVNQDLVQNGGILLFCAKKHRVKVSSRRLEKQKGNSEEINRILNCENLHWAALAAKEKGTARFPIVLRVKRGHTWGLRQF